MFRSEKFSGITGTYSHVHGSLHGTEPLEKFPHMRIGL